MKSQLLGAVCASLLILAATPIYATQIGIYWAGTATGIIGYAGLDGSGQTTLVSGLSQPRGLDVTHDSEGYLLTCANVAMLPFVSF
jgi:hypothetical protein